MRAVVLDAPGGGLDAFRLQADSPDPVPGPDEVRSWFPTPLWDCYLGLKRTELRLLDGIEAGEACRRYAGVY